jgi:hypothetical protein
MKSLVDPILFLTKENSQQTRYVLAVLTVIFIDYLTVFFFNINLLINF